jgi:hypothetical protein
LARKPNYDFEKRRKEMERKTKKEEKLRRKRENAAANPTDETAELTEPGVDGDDEPATE